MNKTHAALISAQGYSSPRRPSVISRFPVACVSQHSRLAPLTAVVKTDSVICTPAQTHKATAIPTGWLGKERPAWEYPWPPGWWVACSRWTCYSLASCREALLLMLRQQRNCLIYLTFFQFSHFRIPKIGPLLLITELVKRNQAFSSLSLLKKTTNSTFGSATLAHVAIKRDYKKKSMTYERGETIELSNI